MNNTSPFIFNGSMVIVDENKPLVVKSDRNIFFDVDDTIAIWPTARKELGISDEDWCNQAISVGTKEITTLVMPHQNHIDFMRSLKAQGAIIVVWSHGGWEWANAVVKAFDIELYVDLIMTKPSLYIDDLDAAKWMPRRIWHHPVKPRNKEYEPK